MQDNNRKKKHHTTITQELSCYYNKGAISNNSLSTYLYVLMIQRILAFKGSCNFSGGSHKVLYSNLIYKSTLADCRFRQCRVRYWMLSGFWPATRLLSGTLGCFSYPVKNFTLRQPFLQKFYKKWHHFLFLVIIKSLNLYDDSGKQTVSNS